MVRVVFPAVALPAADQLVRSDRRHFAVPSDLSQRLVPAVRHPAVYYWEAAAVRARAIRSAVLMVGRWAVALARAQGAVAQPLAAPAAREPSSEELGAQPLVAPAAGGPSSEGWGAQPLAAPAAGELSSEGWGAQPLAAPAAAELSSVVQTAAAVSVWWELSSEVRVAPVGWGAAVQQSAAGLVSEGRP